MRRTAIRGLIPPNGNPAAGSANSRPVWPTNHRSAAVVSVWPADNRSPVGSGASGSIHSLGANNGMGRLGQSEKIRAARAAQKPHRQPPV